MLITKYKRPIQTYPMSMGLELFQEFLNNFDQTGKTAKIVDFNPNVNTREANNAYYIEVDLPGVKKEDVDINIEDNTLIISGKREFENETKEENYYKLESVYGEFSRSFTLPQKVDIQKIEASNTNGVLEVMIPKTNTGIDKVKKIEIK